MNMFELCTAYSLWHMDWCVYATMGICSVYIILLSKHLLGNVDIASKTQILFEILCFHKVAWVYFLKLPHNIIYM